MSLRPIGRGVGVALILAAFGRLTSAQHDSAWPPGGDMPVEWDQPEDVVEIRDDPQIELAQATTRSSSNRSSAARTASRAGRTSRVPYMIGDSTSSPGNVLTFTGIPVSTIEHPIFGGNRFNVAENNSVTPDDRVFASYRHFNNVNQTNVLDQASVLDVERWDLGFEKSALDGLVSAQLVVPLLRQLNSDLTAYDDGFDSNLPVADRHGELGNLAFVGKLLLVNRSRISFSAGMAVNAPTADDARIFQYFDDPSLVVSAAPLVTTNPPTSISMASRFDNDTVNLTPFFAWSAQPTDRFFHQGFLQIDAPLNRSDARVAVSGIISPDSPYDAEAFSVDESGEIDQQTLLRLNLSFGYWLMQGNPGGLVDGLAGLFEVHYTTALEDANPFTVPITTLVDPSIVLPAVPLGAAAGPTSDSFDQVNLTAGVAANIGMLQITNGVIVPVTVGVNRSFDFEYCLQASRRF